MARLRSVAHPVRLRILSLLTAEAMSAADVARALDLTHANASYHLRVLHDAGELVVESKEKVRGGIAKRYRYLVGGDDRPTAPTTNDDLIAWQKATARRGRAAAAPTRHEARAPRRDIETWVTAEAWQPRDRPAIARAAMVLLHAEAPPPRTEGTIHVSASIPGLPDGGRLTDARGGGMRRDAARSRPRRAQLRVVLRLALRQHPRHMMANIALTFAVLDIDRLATAIGRCWPRTRSR